jgi:hypothetical protein
MDCGQVNRHCRRRGQIAYDSEIYGAQQLHFTVLLNSKIGRSVRTS